MENPTLTHFDEAGHPVMVDVSDKRTTKRTAVAESVLEVSRTVKERVEDRQVAKGDVLSIAELAGIMGAKRTSDLIPLCHPVALENVAVSCTWDAHPDENLAWLRIRATATADFRTGVEMEALVACTTAALTVYDMCKAIDKSMKIRDVRLLEKHGGKSGDFRAAPWSIDD